MSLRLEEVDLTPDEITLIFYMTGYCANHIPSIYKDHYESLLKKLEEATRRIDAKK